VVYVRQSSPYQVLHHQESTRLQYGLGLRAQDLGWATERVLVIDEDQATSGASAEGRPGFQQLVSEVSLGHVGIILGFEAAPVVSWPYAGEAIDDQTESPIRVR
jgi:DNA invertase Pin-like site-specific DNA recombinase